MVVRRGDQRECKRNYGLKPEIHREAMHEVEPVNGIQAWLADATWCEPRYMRYAQLDGDVVTFAGHREDFLLSAEQVQQAKDLGLYDNKLAWDDFAEKYDDTKSLTANAQPPISHYSYKARKVIGACLTEIRNRSIIAYLLENHCSAAALQRVKEIAGVTKATFSRWLKCGFISDSIYYKLCPES